MQPPDYFTCTLGQGLEWNKSQRRLSTTATPNGVVQHHGYTTVAEFVDWLAAQRGDRLAAGCLPPSRPGLLVARDCEAELMTFGDVRRLSQAVASSLAERLAPARTPTVALLASSSPIFLLAWLGLMRAGLQVILLAPHSSEDTVHHLLELGGAGALFHDAKHEPLARAAVRTRPGRGSGSAGTSKAVQLVLIPWTGLEDVRSIQPSPSSSEIPPADVVAQPADVAYFFHSSGTTGLPKLISQTNHGAVGILPRLQDLPRRHPPRLSTFTTTPLYHGGIADLLRSWSAGTAIWLFPEHQYPITGGNVKACLEVVRSFAHDEPNVKFPPLGYLSCVPFVLEMLAEEPGTVEILRSLKMVGVGGAAMPRDLGDRLVSEDVNLVSRFGSSECGFLLSSDRAFQTDREWSALRVATKEAYLTFERMKEEGKYELAVSRDWPLVSSAAHAERPFFTHDVFVPHSNIGNAWAYQGRSDAQLTLQTGKKFDPSGIESQLRDNPKVEAALVLGEGRPYPGLLIFTVADLARDDGHQFSTGEVVPYSILEDLQTINDANPSHAQIHPDMIEILCCDQLYRLKKDSKGGIIRSSIATEFSREIERLYSASHSTFRLQTDEPEKNLLIIQRIVAAELQMPDITAETSLFDAGLDSGGAIRIYNRLRAALPDSVPIPRNTVYEYGSIRALAEHLTGKIKGDLNSVPRDKTSEMEAIVQKYVTLQPQLLQRASDIVEGEGRTGFPLHSGKRVVLLTGATGFLGAHILHILLSHSDVSRIYILIRGTALAPPFDEQVTKGKARVRAALGYYRLLSGEHSFGKAIFLPCVFNSPDLGLPSRSYAEISHSVTHIIHAAWEVNFNLPLEVFSSHIEGIVNFFNLAELSSRQRVDGLVRFAFCSSVASIAQSSTDLSTSPSSSPHDASNLGYSQSKWVAERVLHRLAQLSRHTGITILRVGQLSGASDNGIWNRKEAWPLMVDASFDVLSGMFPDLKEVEAPISWLPVDMAAKAVLELSAIIGEEWATQGPGVTFSLVANTGPATTWMEVLDWIAKFGEGHGRHVEVVPAAQWLDSLEALRTEHQAKSLIPLWRGNWTGERGEGGSRLASVRELERSRGVEFDVNLQYVEKLLGRILEGK